MSLLMSWTRSRKTSLQLNTVSKKASMFLSKFLKVWTQYLHTIKHTVRKQKQPSKIPRPTLRLILQVILRMKSQLQLLNTRCLVIFHLPSPQIRFQPKLLLNTKCLVLAHLPTAQSQLPMKMKMHRMNLWTSKECCLSPKSTFQVDLVLHHLDKNANLLGK